MLTCLDKFKIQYRVLCVLCSTLISGNWDEIKYEISLSNVIQRDSSVFARKLEKNLYKFATEKEEQGCISYYKIVNLRLCSLISPVGVTI